MVEKEKKNLESTYLHFVYLKTKNRKEVLHEFIMYFHQKRGMKLSTGHLVLSSSHFYGPRPFSSDFFQHTTNLLVTVIVLSIVRAND